LGQSDRGCSVIITTDAICGSADETHDAAMTTRQLVCLPELAVEAGAIEEVGSPAIQRGDVATGCKEP
jgi:hypothetical protein